MNYPLGRAGLRLIIVPEVLTTPLKRAGIKLEQITDGRLLLEHLSGSDIALLCAANRAAFRTPLVGLSPTDNILDHSELGLSLADSGLFPLMDQMDEQTFRQLNSYAKILEQAALDYLWGYPGTNDGNEAPDTSYFRAHAYQSGLIVLQTRWTFACKTVALDLRQSLNKIVTDIVLDEMSKIWPASSYIPTGLYQSHLGRLYRDAVGA